MKLFKEKKKNGHYFVIQITERWSEQSYTVETDDTSHQPLYTLNSDSFWPVSKNEMAQLAVYIQLLLLNIKLGTHNGIPRQLYYCMG